MRSGTTEASSQQTQPHFEILNAAQLAERLNLPVSWIREMCRNRCSDPIPCLVFGRYRRFRWHSPELDEWINRRLRGAKQ